nr:hypothetical protein [Tanacetum cinerariifolium]
DERGIVIKNKARLVAQGHTQEEGIDYDEVFAPVARIEAIRLFLAYASFMGFTVYQIDVKSAFLYGTIDEEVFEDIIGVTTNSDDSNVVEADVSNMETTITASPTPTLRIHKDHPKSQIIGPVDTPIQTRHKSKEEEGIDYDEVFSPVARIEAIRLFLAYVSFMGFTVYQMDVKSAFIYGTIDEKVYVMQPPGFQDPEFPARVYKVEKAMYGLHQAPRAWHRGDFILVQVYVDNIIFRSSNPQLCREFEALMHEKFQMSAIGELNFFLGLQVLQKKDGIFLSQDKYVGDILEKFRYLDVRSSNTPMDKENPWGKDEIGKDVDLHLYRSMIGYLMYLTVSRPDIKFPVCACVRHQDRKSTTGGCQFLGRRLISWQCKKQTILATSTTETEYVVAASCCGQVLWIQNQLLDYGLSMPCEALSREFSTSMVRFEGLLQDLLEYLIFEAL